MKLYILATLLVVATIVAAETKSYTGYKLVRVTVPNKEQMDYITNLENIDPAVDIWNVGKVNGEHFADIMLSPRAYYQYKKAFGKRNLSVELLNNNVQDIIDYQEQNMELTQLKGASRASIVNKYARYGEIRNFVSEIVENNPTIARLYIAGKSTEGRDLPVIIINPDGTDKKIIWFDCGIHAREWVSPGTCVYIINDIINKWNDGDQEIVALLNKYEFRILPLYNPDGYEYSHSTDRMWRKNRSVHSVLCTGTDLNRNLPYHWNEAGTGILCRQDNYAGPSAASEPETKAVMSALNAIKDKLQAYFTIHSYGNWWLLPYGHDATLFAPNHDELMTNGKLAAQAIKDVHGEVFTVGKSSELLYVTTGTSSDWVYQDFNVPISVTVELRPRSDSQDAKDYGFKLPEAQLPFVTKETWEGLKASIKHIAQNH